MHYCVRHQTRARLILVLFPNLRCVCTTRLIHTVQMCKYLPDTHPQASSLFTL